MRKPLFSFFAKCGALLSVAALLTLGACSSSNGGDTAAEDSMDAEAAAMGEADASGEIDDTPAEPARKRSSYSVGYNPGFYF